MYLRFRKIKSATERATKEDAFNELYEQIHSRLPANIKQLGNPANIKLQVNLVKARRVGNKVRQFHIGTLANSRIHLDDDKRIVMSDDFWQQIRARLKELKIDSTTTIRLLKKIEDYLSKLARAKN